MARIITAEEAGKLGLKKPGNKHRVRAMIEMMRQGELLHITREDFKWKGQSPMRFCKEIAKTTGMKFVLLKARNNQGWVVERVE